MPEITMPRLSDSMEEGTILRWLVEDGAAVSRGDEIAEIETDKANMAYEADADGTFHRVAAEGEALPVGAVIAHLLAEGEEPPAAEAGGDGGAARTEDDDADEADAQPQADAGDATEPAPEPSAADTGAGEAAAAREDGERIRASPVARRLARELGVDLASFSGSGPGGRIVRADVEHAAAEGAAAPEAAAPVQTAGGRAPSSPVAGGPGTGKGETQVVQPTNTQKVIARRMAESKATVPDFQVTTEADVTDLLALRAQMKAARGAAPSVNDFVVKACALALRDHPRANGAWRDGAWELYSRINVGVAVAGDGTLVVPTVFDADLQPVTAIAEQTRALAERVRAGSVTPPELSGGTFTVSNLGMFGVTEFIAVVNPGQAGILAVGAAVKRAAPAEDGSLTWREVMALTLSCDHRILYGADGAQFLARVRELLETPLGLLS